MSHYLKYLLVTGALSSLMEYSSALAVDPNENKFEVDKNLFPYQSQYLILDNGARVHYVDEGKGPVLLLLHGNPTWSFLYRHIIAELKNEFRVVAPDYPGFGLSSAPQGYRFTAAEQAASMVEFVEKLDLWGLTLMVQDWGGPIGFFIAEKHPDRVKGFVIGNSWAWPLERNGQKIFSSLMGGWPGQFMAWCCNGVVRFFMSKGLERDLSDAEMAMYLAPFSERNARRQTHVFPAQLRDAAPFLQEVYSGLSGLSDRPALIIWGVEDFAFQEPERTRFEKIFSNHQTVLLEDAAHFIQEDAPSEITEAIRHWYPK
ncbi:alpha/beta hydrolase [bacterium endosymbiont of Escarpia laminata]|nr:MAG: alpha/beta hydrolase [bacterium endosymbiont of Escarpia laminata]RLJ22222.1 MAG: alpha/beta hydrolase [bacterium endosymbiont of Escarpia laminata]